MLEDILDGNIATYTHIMFQPLTPAFASNPYEVYARLRALKAPYYFEDMNVHLLSRYEDVEAVARQGAMVR